MMTCKEAHKLMIRAQDARLPLARRMGLRFHLFICDACANFNRQLAWLRAGMRALSNHDDDTANQQPPIEKN